MSTTSVALILAAGNGSRLAPVSGGMPKPLVKLRGKPILEHIMSAAHEAGIQKFVIVVGYHGDAIRSWIARCPLDGVEIELVENHEYKKDNGVSVLKAADAIDGPFLLLMGDHLFQPGTATALLQQPLNEDEVILAIDYGVERIFDLDDATKVACEGGYITAIGKNIEQYEAIDTGMFLCSPVVFSSLRSALKKGNCSLSDAMRVMISNRKLRSFDIGDGLWQDVDTPQAFAHAELLAEQHIQFLPEAILV